MDDSSILKIAAGVFLLIAIVLIVVWSGDTTQTTTTTTSTTTTLPPVSNIASTSTTTSTIPHNPTIPTTTTLVNITTFIDSGQEVELKDGKPVIRLFSTTWCPHCRWVSDAYEEVAMEYVNAGKIVAYHWEFDTNDDTLRAEKVSVPQREQDLFRDFNPRGTIPTYVFAKKYYRVGNGHETEQDLEAEKAEFRAVIEDLLAEANQQ